MLGTILAIAATSVTTIGDFAYVETTDPMTDAAIYGVTLSSTDADLSIACDTRRARTIFLKLETKRSLAYPAAPILAGFMSFDYRVDSEKPINEFVRYGLRDVLVEGAQARAFAARISMGRKLVVQVEGLSGAITAQFRIEGGREAIAKLAQQCGDQRLIARLTKP